MEHETKKKLRVLIVDDSMTNLCVTRATLESLGCTVSAAEDGTSALDHIAQNSFDLMFIDYHMPDMSGAELASSIRERLKDATPPMIALTAGRSPDTLKSCREAGMQLVLNKPVPRQQMQLLVDRLFSQEKRT